MSENENQTFMEKVKNIVQKIKSKKKIMIGITGIIVIAAGIIAYGLSNRVPSDKNMQNMPMFSVSGNDVMGNYVMASGTTSLGYTMEEFEPDYIETELYIEDVYLSYADEVEAGTAVFKVSQESITEARDELKEKEVEADLAYRAGVISYEQSKINAKYTCDAALLEGEQAEAVYHSALKTAEKNLQKAKDNVTETEAKIEEYKTADADYYYQYNLDKYKERYESNHSFYYTFLGRWGFNDADISGGGGGNQDPDYIFKKQVLQQMKTNLQNSERNYYSAWDEYEAAANQANSDVKKLEIQIDGLRADLAEAETDYQIEVLEAETAYKKSLAQLDLAKSNYDATIQKAEGELETLEDEKTEAQENIAEFESLLGDGCFYAKNSGTVMMIGVNEDSALQGGGMVLAYRNAQDISVTVSVSQEDIDKLRVGDEAQVIVEDYGTFEGEIAYINPISNSSSRTNITYEVLVELKGNNVEMLKENLTANVIFTTGDSSQ